jgi:threonine dehydrogenase-like Zn-dependent dehydrogenase
MAFTYMRTQVLGHYGSEAHHTKELVEFVRAGRLNLKKSVSEVMPLDEAASALEKLEKKIGNPIRIVLKP